MHSKWMQIFRAFFCGGSGTRWRYAMQMSNISPISIQSFHIIITEFAQLLPLTWHVINIRYWEAGDDATYWRFADIYFPIDTAPFSIGGGIWGGPIGAFCLLCSVHSAPDSNARVCFWCPWIRSVLRVIFGCGRCRHNKMPVNAKIGAHTIGAQPFRWSSDGTQKNARSQNDAII